MSVPYHLGGSLESIRPRVKGSFKSRKGIIIVDGASGWCQALYLGLLHFIGVLSTEVCDEIIKITHHVCSRYLNLLFY